MGILDTVIKAAHAARDQAGQLAHKHGDKIDRAIDKGGTMIDQRTHGKYTDKIAKAQGVARDAAGKAAAASDQAGHGDRPGHADTVGGPDSGRTPTPPPPPPTSPEDDGTGGASPGAA